MASYQHPYVKQVNRCATVAFSPTSPFIATGTMAGAITQNPVGIGYETVKAAVAAIKGEELPKIIDTGFYWYDKSNIDDPKIAAVLYD